MEQPLGVMGAPGVSFFSLIIIGGFAGWIAGMITGSRHGLFTNILIGIVGSWLGSKIAELLNIAVVGSIAHFIAALIGSVIVLIVWMMVRGESAAPR
jgi:uncharacterized membrane protein YeaQ/YmgE (transglycosylase-associated protein family)